MYTPDKIILQLLRSKDLVSGASHDIRRYFMDGLSPKLPEPELLEYGEIALNIAKNHEVIAIKNYDGDVVCIPFDIAARVISDEESVASLSAYTVSSISELSGITEEIYETIDDLKEAIDIEIAEAVAQLQEKISDVASSVSSLSAETFESIGRLDGEIERISAFTESVSEYVNESVSAISGDVESFREEFVVYSGETEERLEFLEDNISGSTEINERLDEIELVHAGAFAAFRKATGVDTNVHYNPALPALSGFNMTEAIDYVGGYAESLDHETESIKTGVINDEIVHAAAFARMNHSLGFTENAEYEPSETSTEIANMTVTEAIDYLYNSNAEIVDYLGMQDTKQIIRTIMYEKLYKLYKEKQLITGMMYRISNYQATINQNEYYGEFETRVPVVASDSYTSMGFDIIVRALSSSELDENAVIGISRNKYHFNTSRLNAWQAKYCIENDTARFDWASPNGFGVIYWLKDEYCNEAPYDFKNIMRKVNGTKYYLFSNGTGDTSLNGRASSNIVKPTVLASTGRITLPTVTFIGSSQQGNTVASGIDGLFLEGDFHDCVISSAMSGTTIEGPKSNELIGYKGAEDENLQHQIDELVADGTTTDLHLSTSMEFVGTTVNVVVTATCSNDGIISIRESGGEPELSPSPVNSFARTFVNVTSNSTFIAGYTIRGIGKPEKSANITFVYPIYYGAADAYDSLVNTLHRATKRSSLNGTYNVTVSGTSTYIWFVIPQTMGTIHTAKMGGFDFSLNAPTVQQIDGVNYYVYRTPQKQELGSYSITLT